MKVLALYDIHGNPDALEAVLADPRARDADIVVVGGDVVPGALARQTLDRLDRLAAVAWVRGNGEREVAAAAAAGRRPLNQCLASARRRRSPRRRLGPNAPDRWAICP